MRKQFSSLLPAPWIICIWSLLYFGSYLIDLWFSKYNEPVPTEIITYRFYLLIAFSGVYGLTRILNFNPIIKTAYSQWLMLTPWQYGKKLPKGPTHLVWTDFVLISILSILSWINNHEYFLMVPFVFILVYLLVLNILLINTKQAGYVVAALFIAPLAIHPYGQYIAIPILTVLYILGFIAIRKCLIDYPFNMPFWTENIVEKWRKQAFSKRIVGWPYKNLLQYPEKDLNARYAFLISLCITWWAHIIFLQAQAENMKFGFALFIFLIGAFRLMAYALPYRSPISLWGRIMTGNLIIPRHDKIFIAPVVIWISACLLLFILAKMGLSLALRFEAVLFTTLFLAFTLPPSYRKWQLTGAHQSLNYMPVQSNRKQNTFINSLVQLGEKQS